MKKTILATAILALVALAAPRPAAAEVSFFFGLPGVSVYGGPPVVYAPPAYAPPIYAPPVYYGYGRPYYAPAYYGRYYRGWGPGRGWHRGWYKHGWH